MSKGMSKTQQALSWMRENPDETIYRAAKVFRLHPNTLYTAVSRERDKEGRERCPVCDHVLLPGQEVRDPAGDERRKIVAALRNTAKQSEGAEKRKWCGVIADGIEQMP